MWFNTLRIQYRGYQRQIKNPRVHETKTVLEKYVEERNSRRSNRSIFFPARSRLQEDRLSFVAQGPLDAIMRCLKGGRAAQQQCALDALTTVRGLGGEFQ